MRMWAVVAEPSRTFPSTRNVTSALPWLSATSETVPTLTPETLTSLPGARPPASVNSAWWRTVVASENNRCGCRPTMMTSRISARPMKPERMRAEPRYFNIRAQRTFRCVA